MREYQYAIILHPDPEHGSYGVTVPALPGCVTQGDTIEDAIAMAKEAISLHIEGLMADGEPVPEETEHPQALTISVTAPADVAALAAHP
jgi:antitoxin HicB